MSSDKNEMLEAAQRVWSMLDHLYENNPAEYKKFVDQQMKEGKEALTPPEPVFCLMCQVTGVSSNLSNFVLCSMHGNFVNLQRGCVLVLHIVMTTA